MVKSNGAKFLIFKKGVMEFDIYMANDQGAYTQVCKAHYNILNSVMRENPLLEHISKEQKRPCGVVGCLDVACYAVGIKHNWEIV